MIKFDLKDDPMLCSGHAACPGCTPWWVRAYSSSRKTSAVSSVSLPPVGIAHAQQHFEIQ